MRRIVYYVATSLDGYIAGPKGDISLFAQQEQGEGVQQYLSDLQEFDTVIMGRKTYEFGYQYGLTPGQLAYPQMKHYIFSSTLNFENQHPNLQIVDMDLSVIQELKSQEGSDIYLCGGGEFASWLLANELIDILKIKSNPILLGEGIRLFGPSKVPLSLKIESSILYADGLQINTYRFEY